MEVVAKARTGLPDRVRWSARLAPIDPGAPCKPAQRRADAADLLRCGRRWSAKFPRGRPPCGWHADPRDHGRANRPTEALRPPGADEADRIVGAAHRPLGGAGLLDARVSPRSWRCPHSDGEARRASPSWSSFRIPSARAIPGTTILIAKSTEVGADQKTLQLKMLNQHQQQQEQHQPPGATTPSAAKCFSSTRSIVVITTGPLSRCLPGHCDIF